MLNDLTIIEDLWRWAEDRAVKMRGKSFLGRLLLVANKHRQLLEKSSKLLEYLLEIYAPLSQNRRHNKAMPACSWALARGNCTQLAQFQRKEIESSAKEGESGWTRVGWREETEPG